MPHLNDPKLAAQLLSGISFTINHTSRGDFSLQHVKYDCTLSYGDGENDILHTSYQSVPNLPECGELSRRTVRFPILHEYAARHRQPQSQRPP